MRRFIQTVLLLLLILTLAGCDSSSNSARNTSKGNAVENAISEQIDAADAEQNDMETEEADTETNEPETTAPSEGTAAQAEESTESDGTGTADYDLTGMNSDMVYATVYQMMVNPDDYIGKTVKMSGPFYPYTNADGTVYYPACIIEDALACCAQGMEFVVTDARYPDDYPEMGTEITVIGTFETYQEDGYLYCHLIDAVLEE